MSTMTLEQVVATLTYVYTRGYRHGHESTVDGHYIDVNRVDYETWHSDVVSEIVAEEPERFDYLTPQQAAQPKTEQPRGEVATFIMDSVTVQIHGDQDSIARVMNRIHETSDRLGNYIEQPKPEQAAGDGVVAEGRELVRRLRDTPNWMKESFGEWKSATTKYDRAPKDAADFIERMLTTPRPAVATPVEVRDDKGYVSAEELERLADHFDDGGWRTGADYVNSMMEAATQVRALAAHPHTGYSAVPEEPEGCDENACVSYRYGYRSGWTACRRAMLAAAPEVPNA